MPASAIPITRILPEEPAPTFHLSLVAPDPDAAEGDKMRWLPLYAEMTARAEAAENALLQTDDELQEARRFINTQAAQIARLEQTTSGQQTLAYLLLCVSVALLGALAAWRR